MPKIQLHVLVIETSRASITPRAAGWNDTRDRTDTTPQRRSETERVAAPPLVVRAVPIVDTPPEELDPFGYPLDLISVQDVEYSDELKAEMDEYEKRERAEGWAIEREAALGILDGSIPGDLDQDARAFLVGELEYHARKHRDKFSEEGCGAPSCDLCAELPP